MSPRLESDPPATPTPSAPGSDPALGPVTAPVPGPDVLAPVRRMGVRASRAGMVIGVLVALATHGSASARAASAHLEILASAERMRGAMRDYVKQFDIDVDEPAPPPPKEEEPPPPPPPPEVKEPEPPPPPPPTNTPPPPPKDIYDEPQRAAAAAADAPKILTADDKSPYADMSDEMVSGNGEGTYGYVTPNGTGTAPTYDPRARKDGENGGTGTGPVTPPPPPPPKVNRSRPADLVGSRSWSCPFPPEADAEQINRATAVVVVTVATSGAPASARVVSDPGYGFGRAAQQCALARRYSPALDADGTAITSTTPPINVTFRR